MNKIDHFFELMNIHMTYEQLVVLNAIVNEGTFRAAAEKLNKSQSAVSHMLKKLEGEIGVELLSRQEYRPKLTSAGEVFYRQATRVIQQMRKLKRLSNSISSEQESEVFIAVTATFPLKNVLKIIGITNNKYPTTHIRMSRESMGGPVDCLLTQSADIIISTMDGVPIDQVEALPFQTVEIVPVIHPSLEPATTTHMKSISEMQSYTQIVVADSSKSSNTQSRDLLPGGLRWTVSDFAAKKEVILSGLGWGGLPSHLRQKELDSGELVAINIEGYPRRQSQLFQIRLRDKAVGIVSQEIWEQLRAASSLVGPKN